MLEQSLTLYTGGFSPPVSFLDHGINGFQIEGAFTTAWEQDALSTALIVARPMRCRQGRWMKAETSYRETKRQVWK